MKAKQGCARAAEGTVMSKRVAPANKESEMKTKGNAPDLGQLSQRYGIVHEGFVDVGDRTFTLLRVGPWYHAFEAADLTSKGITSRDLAGLMNALSLPTKQLVLF